VTLLERDSVTVINATGWSVTFLDFVRLMTDPADRAAGLPLLRSFGYEVVQEEPLLFRDGQGQTLQAEDVHTQIQNDSSQQYQLYQTTMDLWR
jgi:hypothetical protein